MRSLQTIGFAANHRRSAVRQLYNSGEVRLDDRKFGIFRRSARSWLASRRSTNGGVRRACQRRQIGQDLAWKRRLSGECRTIPPSRLKTSFAITTKTEETPFCIVIFGAVPIHRLD